MIGQRYRVERELGVGGMGAVWAGVSLVDGSQVALKTLLEASKQNRELVTRFKREADFLARLESPYISKVIDFLSVPDYGLVLVMELVEGESLRRVLLRETLTVEQAIDVGRDVLRGIAALSRAQIIHRDLKPGNLITQKSGDHYTRTVIVDFGMSRFAGLDGDGDEITALTRVDIAVGTMEYMSPEQILNSRSVTTAADIYALGAMLYRAVAGVHVFGDLEDVDLARHKLITDPPPLSTGRTDAVAREFERIVTRMIQRKPDHRYQSAEEALDALAALTDAETTLMANPEHYAPAERSEVTAPMPLPSPPGASPLPSSPGASPMPSSPLASAPYASAPYASAPGAAGYSPESSDAPYVGAALQPAPQSPSRVLPVLLTVVIVVAVVGLGFAWKQKWIAFDAPPAEHGPVIEAVPEPARAQTPALLAPVEPKASATPEPSADAAEPPAKLVAKPPAAKAAAPKPAAPAASKPAAPAAKTAAAAKPAEKSPEPGEGPAPLDLAPKPSASPAPAPLPIDPSGS